MLNQKNIILCSSSFIKKRLLFFFIAFLLSSVGEINVLGMEFESPVLIETILPDNQQDKSVEYFDLKMQPSEKQLVKIKVSNQNDKSINLKLVYSNAKTTSEGVIEYSENKDLKLNTPVGYSFEELISGPSKITVPGHETLEIEFLISMPDTVFQGAIAGGIEFIQEVEKDQKSSLLTQRSYLVGFKLTETDNLMPTSIELGTSIVGTKNYKSAIIIPLENLNASYVEELSVSATIIAADSTTVVIEEKKNQMRMAPLSILEYPIYLEQTLLEIGDYELVVQAEARDGFKKEWSQSFEVTQKDSELIKSNSDLWENTTKSNSLRNFFFLVLFITLVTLLIIVFIKKRGEKNGKKKNKK